MQQYLEDTNNKELDWMIKNLQVLMKNQRTLKEKIEFLESGKHPEKKR
jgi:hypothetical protein